MTPFMTLCTYWLFVYILHSIVNDIDVPTNKLIGHHSYYLGGGGTTYVSMLLFTHIGFNEFVIRCNRVITGNESVKHLIFLYRNCRDTGPLSK